jgi:hypothetical protein
VVPEPLSQAAPPQPAVTATPVHAPAHSAVHDHEVATDGLPFMPADPDAGVPPGPLHPHPITPKHERIFRENALYAQLNGAVDVRDAAGIRRLLKEYRDEYPEDEHRLQEGFEAIANCIEHPGEASRAAAQRYYDTEITSTIRRYVRRNCFE